jgi:anti-anti-sigma factor
MKNFELRHERGYLITSVNVEKASFQEAIEFKGLIDEEIDHGYSDIIISLNDCDFVDSAFIGVLVVIWKKVRTKGGSLKLVKLGNFNHSVLHLTGTIEIFDKYNSVGEALASYVAPLEQLNN